MKIIVACVLSLLATVARAQETANPCAAIPQPNPKTSVMVPDFVQPDPSPTAADLATSAAGLLWLRIAEIRELNVERISGGAAPSGMAQAYSPRQSRDEVPRPEKWYAVSGSVRFAKGKGDAPDLASVNATLYQCGKNNARPTVLYGRQREFPLDRAYLELTTLGDFFAALLQGKVTPVSAEARPAVPNLPRQELQSTAEALLCLSKIPSCVPNYEQAMKLLEPVAKDAKRPLTDSYLLFLLGKAQFAGKHEVDAATTLGAAVKYLNDRPGKNSTAPPAASYQLELLTLAGDASSAAGSFREAAQYYRHSLRIDARRPTVAASYIRALRFSGVPLDALREGLAQLKRADLPEIHKELLQGVADLNLEDLADALPVLEEAIKQQPAREEYALALSRAAGEMLRTSPHDSAAVATNLDKAVKLGAQEPRVTADIYLNLALLHLEKSDSAAVERDLQTLDALPAATLPGIVQELKERVRAMYYLAQRRFDEAVAAAEHARAVNPASDETNLIVARSYVEQASQRTGEDRSHRLSDAIQISSQLAAKRVAGADPVYVKAASGSAQTSPALQLYRRLLKENPQDFSAVSSVVSLCASINDVLCAAPAMDGYASSVTQDDLNSRELSIAEVDVLKRDYVEAQRLLDLILASHNTPPELLTVGRYYQVWIALVDCRADVKQKHAALAAAKLQASPVGKWEFSWARTLLPAENFAREKEEYLTKTAEVLEGIIGPDLPTLPRSCEAAPAAALRDEGGQGVAGLALASDR